MIPWEELGRAKVPGNTNELILRKRGQEFSIQTAGIELMNSRIHGSEDALATLALDCTKAKGRLEILIGGLGMGYTLGAALAKAGPKDAILVSELVSEVVFWNQNHLGHLAGMPLDDPRVALELFDVGSIIAASRADWDVILLDVDNGPSGLTQKSNNSLYTRAGVNACFKALAPGGVLAVWSAGVDDAYTRSLNQCGFKVKSVVVRAMPDNKGSRHIIWLAVKP
jgi:spermidine synthase